jgi:hypothetical protein
MQCACLTCFAVPPKDQDAESPTHEAKAPPDYELLPGLGYYKFHTDIKTWEKARDVCEKEGAHLAVINSLTEAKSLPLIWIRNLFKDWREDAAYIGTWDPQETGDFITIFSKYFVRSDTFRKCLILFCGYQTTTTLDYNARLREKNQKHLAEAYFTILSVPWND